MVTTNRPLVALKALAALARDPDDLPKVFTIIESLPGRSLERIHRQMSECESGKRLLATQPDLGAQLSDRTWLAGLAEGTLGRSYFELTERANISAQGIAVASMAERVALPRTGELGFAGMRMRDSHDLWHVVTGYGTDALGELALLAFTQAQAPHLGIGLIVGAAYLQFDRSVNTLLREAYRRGKRAAWLPAIEWEAQLERPLASVREELELGAPPSYLPIPSSSLRGGSVTRRFFTGNFFKGAQA